MTIGDGVLRRDGDEVEFDSAESDDEDWMTPDEMLRSGSLKKRLDHQKRWAKFPSINCPELQGKRLELLTKVGDEAQPGGSLVQYNLAHEQLGNIRWAMLSMNEAHTAR